MQPGTISADGRWYWSGVRWEATLSADGRWRWAGTGWRPAEKDIAAVDPPAAGHKTVRGALAGGMLYALLVIAVGGLAAFGDVSNDGLIVAAVGLILVLVQGLALLLLLTGRGWRRVMEQRQPNRRLSLVLSLLLFGGLVVALFALIFVVGAAGEIARVGLGDFRELVLVLLLLGGPGTAFLRLTSGGWRWVLLARGRRQVAAPVVVGLAVLGAATTILGVTALAWYGADNAGDRLGALAVGGFLLTLLVLPVVGLLGLAWGREFGRIVTTAASIQWALTGLGLLVAIPTLWLVWRAPDFDSELSRPSGS